MGEFKRLFSKKFLILLLVMVVANCGLFAYQQMEGKSFSEIDSENRYRKWCQERYSGMEPADAVKLIAEDDTMLSAYVKQNKNDSNDESIQNAMQNARPDKPQNTIVVDINNPVVKYYDGLSDTEKERFRSVIKETKQKLSYINGYDEKIAGIQESAESMKKFSIFAKKDSFSYNNIVRTAADFKRLEGIELSLVNDKAVGEFTTHYYTFYIAMAMMLLVVYNLFAERENGMWSIVHSTASGRMWTGIVRGIVLMVISLAVTAALYFTVFITSLVMYGGAEWLLTPIQTLGTYGNFTYPISKLAYVLLNFVFSWFAIYALSIIIWMLFCICRKRNHALVIAGVLFGVEMLCYQKISAQSVYAIFKQINVVRLLNINQILATYENRGFGTFVMAVSVITVLILVVILVISYAASVVATVKIRPEQKKTIFAKFTDKIWIGYQRIFAPVPVTVKEFHKLLITGKGFVVMAAMVVIAFYFAANGKMAFSDTMKERDKIYLEQGGSDYSQIEELVNERLKEYDEARLYAEEVAEKYNNGEIDITEFYNAMSNFTNYGRRLQAVQEFMTKMEYLDVIEEEYGVKGYLISDRGYESIFGKYGKTRELILLIVLAAAIMLIISESSMLETRTGMSSIVRSAKKGRDWLSVRKAIAAVAMTTLLFALVYGIDYIQLAGYYGLPYLGAPIMSLTFMEGCKFNVTIGGWILLRLLVRYIVAMAVMAIAILSSKLIGKKGNRAFTILILVGIIAVIVVLDRVGWLL